MGSSQNRIAVIKNKEEKTMQGMIGMSKKDLIEFINKNFSECHENDMIATFFYCNDGYDRPQQQCILFRKEIKNIG